MKKIEGTNEYSSDPYVANFSVKMETQNKNYYYYYQTLYKNKNLNNICSQPNSSIEHTTKKIADIEYDDTPDDKVYKEGESWRTGKRYNIDKVLIDRCELCNKKSNELYRFYYKELGKSKNTVRTSANLIKGKMFILVCHQDISELLECYEELDNKLKGNIFAYLPPDQKELLAVISLRKKYNQLYTSR
jgi:hypothetical protein|tara:strand:- start:92 stop:658 length:567 start_codon:yes stop_codon:yes gene_type:complete